jgi:hypothetical protein
MRETDCGLRIVDCEIEPIQFLHQQSLIASDLPPPIRNPQSTVRNGVTG